MKTDDEELNRLFDSPVGLLRDAVSPGPGWIARYDALVPQEFKEKVAAGAIVFCNHSSGKDSQAMFHFLRRHVPDNQLRVIHADLPEVEWEGVQKHIKETILGHALHTCRSRRTLLQMIEERGMFPSPKNRQCTSDLKRGPLEKLIRSFGNKLIISCMGLRAQESHKRATLERFKYSERNSKNGREWYEYLPIFDWDVNEVFDLIHSVGQKPHWAYAAGMSRVSCAFCIMSSRADLTTAAKLNPTLYKKYVELERSTGQVMLMPSKTRGRQTLEQVTGIFVDAPLQGGCSNREEEELEGLFA